MLLSRLEQGHRILPLSGNHAGLVLLNAVKRLDEIIAEMDIPSENENEPEQDEL